MFIIWIFEKKNYFFYCIVVPTHLPHVNVNDIVSDVITHAYTQTENSILSH